MLSADCTLLVNIPILFITHAFNTLILFNIFLIVAFKRSLTRGTDGSTSDATFHRTNTVMHSLAFAVQRYHVCMHVVNDYSTLPLVRFPPRHERELLEGAAKRSGPQRGKSWIFLTHAHRWAQTCTCAHTSPRCMGISSIVTTTIFPMSRDRHRICMMAILVLLPYSVATKQL